MNEADIEYEGHPPPWTTPLVAAALEAAAMPPESLAMYARWWQLETWLRELVYVELRALLGKNWQASVKQATARLAKDALYTHMAAADSENPLAYLDYTQLLQVIDARWDQCGYALLERAVWDGRQTELAQIRHRIGHLRAPHSDDIARLEQTLRDLERGCFIALASYNRRHIPATGDHTDAVTQGWLGEQHPDAQRFIEHAYQRYETRLHISASRRPWAAWPTELDGAPGILWHARFFLRGRAIDPAALWRDSYVVSVRPLIVHMLTDDQSSVEFTYSAVDGSTAIADAIGTTFDAVLHNARPWNPHTEGGLIGALAESTAWQTRARRIDYRIVSGTGWNIVDESTVPISNFGAGGGVTSVPNW